MENDKPVPTTLHFKAFSEWLSSRDRKSNIESIEELLQTIIEKLYKFSITPKIIREALVLFNISYQY